MSDEIRVPAEEEPVIVEFDWKHALLFLAAIAAAAAGIIGLVYFFRMKMEEHRIRVVGEAIKSSIEAIAELTKGDE